MTLPPPPPSSSSHHPRTVARGLVNLGNSCYMNAVLQALAHAPELCLAMDCESHRATCPIAAENALKRRKNSPSSSPDQDDAAAAAAAAAVQDAAARNKGTRKSRRTGRKSPPAAAAADTASTDSDGMEFCALCEVENHIRHVHQEKKKDKPVAPSAFVHGFIDNVAPEFQLGVQEDSHEFLRLLIDAMQKSCQRARRLQDDNNNNNNADPHVKEVQRSHDNPQDDSPKNNGDDDEHDTEYPFSLFRGTVESNVVCEYCQHSSSTLDPIEDVGLEVTVSQPSTPPSTMTSTSNTMDRSSRNPVSLSSSRNTSPVPSTALADVQSAFKRFARAEALDSGYKCEKCGKVGRATKQSRLASIPPILTLHLKRFRYGDRVGAQTALAPTRRSCRSEVSQLLGSNEYSSGKSGSAKIEGHIKFELVIDLKPYLTEELSRKHQNMYCRLFAVIVHAGKNSHSGHYIAYVCSFGKNEWWKMDDSRVTRVPWNEVGQAEAYMLFYRVMGHPVATRLEEVHKSQVLQEQNSNVAAVSIPPIISQSSPNNNRKRSLDETSLSSPPNKCNKRSTTTLEEFVDMEDWGRKTDLPPNLKGLMQRVSEMIAGDLQLSSRYGKTITDEATFREAAVGKGPRTKCSDGDIAGGTDTYAELLQHLFEELNKNPSAAANWLSKLDLDPKGVKDELESKALSSVKTDPAKQMKSGGEKQQQARVAVEVLPDAEAAEAAGFL